MLGKLSYSLEILECDVVASEDVEDANFIYIFWSVVKNFFAGINVN